MDPTARNSAEESTRTSECARAEQITRALQARLRTRGNGTLKYRIGDEIGRGGMGRVFHAHDEDLRRDIAMKVIRATNGERDARANGGPSSMELARFLEEAQVTGQLDHPGIVPVHELGLDADGQVYFTMKLVRGEDLSRVLEHALTGAEGWNATRVVGALLKVCEAMAYAHSKNVIHRDLKPSNIRIGRFGAVYVMDWGLARVLGQPDDRDLRVRELDPAAASRAVSSERHSDGPGAASLHTMDGTPIGTPMFMSPEQAMGRLDRMGPQTDVYGIGAILYTLLTGQTPYVSPFTQVGPLQIVEWIKEGPPTPIVELAPRATPELVAICDKAMSRDPSLRYADMSELADELRAYLESRVVRAYRTGPWPEFVLWVRRNRAVAALVAATLFVALVGSASVASLESRRADEVALQANQLVASELLRQVGALGPIEPSSVDRFVAWLREATRLTDMIPSVESRLESERASALSSGAAIPYERGATPEVELRLQEARGWLAEFSDVLAEARRILAGDPPENPRVVDPEVAHQVLPREIAYWTERVRELESEGTPIPSLKFREASAQARFDALLDFSVDLRELEEKAIPRIRARLSDARGLESRTIHEESAAKAWSEAIRSITDPTECPLYASRLDELIPQVGLIPLRKNRRTGLWEFWHVLSGERPVLGADDEWLIGDDTGMVLVLLPGGDVVIGAQKRDPSAPRYDKDASDTERPWRAHLDPFFIAAHEVTQGQWLALGGGMESQNFAGRQLKSDPRTSRAHPVECVSARDFSFRLGRVGLSLPTEAQFESALRAGTNAIYVRGNEPVALDGFVNCASEPKGHDRGRLDFATGTSNFTTRVGSFAPNAFGLFDVLGNVSEICVDNYTDSHDRPDAEPGTGRRHPIRPRERVVRGGDYRTPAPALRASLRFPMLPDSVDAQTGARAARLLDTATR